MFDQLKEVTDQSKLREKELGAMISKGVELEGLLAELRTKDKQKDETIEQLKQDLHQQGGLLERSREVQSSLYLRHFHTVCVLTYLFRSFLLISGLF